MYDVLGAKTEIPSLVTCNTGEQRMLDVLNFNRPETIRSCESENAAVCGAAA